MLKCNWNRGLLLAPVLATVLLAPCVGQGDVYARVENAKWSAALTAFRRDFKIPSFSSSFGWEKARAPRLAATAALAEVADGRAVPILFDAHKKQARFIDGVRTAHDRRRAKWLRVLPVREPVIIKRWSEGRALGADEEAWLRDESWCLRDWIHVLEERKLAVAIRRAIADVLNRIDGEERAAAMKIVVRAVGNGDKKGQVEFLRMLGLVAAPEATALLRELSQSERGLVARHALECLGQQNAAESIDFLLGRLDDPSWGNRVAALHGLAHYRVVRVIEALLERGPKTTGVLRRHVYSALAAITGKSLPAVPSRWTGFWADEANRKAVFDSWGKDRGPGRVGTELVLKTVRAMEASTSYYGITTSSRRIVFVVDFSLSMTEYASQDGSDTRLDVARRELESALGSLRSKTAHDPEGGWFNIVAYGSSVEAFRTGKMVPATRQNKAKAIAWLKARKPDGLTNIHDALEMAFEISGPLKVGKRLDDGGDTMFLMTDGVPTRGKTLQFERILESVRRMNRGRGMTIHTVGVDAAGVEHFLKELARQNRGEFIARGG